MAFGPVTDENTIYCDDVKWYSGTLWSYFFLIVAEGLPSCHTVPVPCALGKEDKEEAYLHHDSGTAH
jgi:hypothetical protein